jgi:predicted amidohydrolase YtcJ
MMRNGAADLAILDCSVRTLDPARPFAAAVAVRDGTIVGVGDARGVRELCDDATELIDGRGMFLTPGLIDLHQHTIYALPFLRGADLTAVRSLSELRTAMAQEKARAEEGQWVLGWGLIYDVFPEGRVSNSALDEAVGGSPALVRMYDGHASVATNKAIELAGIHEPTEFPDGSKIVFEYGRPTGEIREMAAVSHLTAAAPPLSDSQRVAAMVALLRRFNAAGLTCVHLMCDRGDPVGLARVLEAQELLTLRLIIPVWARPGEDAEVRGAQLSIRDEHGKLWRRGVVKLFADGVIDNGTAWLLEPDANGESQSPVWRDRDEYAEAVRLFSAAGFQCATHCVGDGAVADVLDAYARAGHPPGLLHRIDHLETLPDSLVQRCAAEEVVLSMQPLGLFVRQDDGADAWTRNLGQERAERGWRCRDLQEAGALVSLSSDFPVAPFDPRVGMAWARLRREPQSDRPAFEPDQCLTGLEALEGYTSRAAYVLGEQATAGRIAEGCRADITGFAEDPVVCDADDLADLPVQLTVVDGRVVYGDQR